MKVKAKTLEECTTLLEIEIPKDRIDSALEEVFLDITKVANIPGFRAGKAPQDLVRKHYAPAAKEEVLKRLIPEAYRSAVDEHKLAPIGMPEISDVVFEDGKPLLFKAKVSTRPKLKLKSYKGIAVDRKKPAVKDEDIEKTLESVREMHATYAAVEDRSVEMGDYVVSDLECSVGGVPLHKKRENLWIWLDKDALVPELHEKMVGMKPGEERDIEVVLPEKYPDAKFAGKSARYHVRVNEIKTRRLPALSDEFAKDLGKESLAAVRDEVRSELLRRSEASSELEVENAVLGTLIDENDFAVPSALVDRQLSYMIEDAKERLLKKGLRKEDVDKHDKEFTDKFKADALRRVRLLFILAEVARLEKIDVDDKDVSEAYTLIASQTGKPESEVRAHYEKEELVDDLREKLREEKTIRVIVSSAKVTEKSS